VTYWDPDGAIVRTDEVGYGVIKATMGDEVLAKNISWNAESGLIDVNRSIRTDNTNYIALRYLVDSAQEVRVNITNKVSFFDKQYNSVNETPLGYDGLQGLTIYPREGRPEAVGVHDEKFILCAVGPMNNKSKQARALAHELYGHVYLYISNKAFLHELNESKTGADPNGFVNKYIDKIEKRRY